MNLALATDSNYLPLVHIALESYFETNTAPLHVHLLTNEVPEEALGQLRELVAQKVGTLSVYPIDNLKERLGIDVPSTISVTSYARLFLPTILSGEIEKVLYADCDILFTGDISDFYATEMKGALVAGIQDLLLCSSYKDSIGISREESYINAGVLLIPLDTWRKEKLQDRFLEFLLSHNGKVYHHDQGIINAVCAGRKLVCPPRYNVISNYFIYPYKTVKRIAGLIYDESQYRQASENPAIIHFTGIQCGRPWESICSHPYKKRYEEVKSRTIYKDLPIRQISLSFIDRMEKIMFHILPFNLFVLFIRTLFFASKVKHCFAE